MGELDEERTRAASVYEWHGSGPPVVLIHGLGLRRAMWQWQLPALVPHFRVLTYDLLGHGESAKPLGKPQLATFAAQLLGLLDRCGIERAALVGFSLGGMIARRVVLDAPERVSALAILNSSHARAGAEREAVLARVREARARGPSATVDAALERWFTAPFRSANPALMTLIRDWILANDAAVYPDIYRLVAEADAELIAGIERIACPTLVMTGGDDRGNSPQMAHAMADAIAGARVVVLPGLRHMALAESPAAVNAPLVEFLRAALAV